jgi:hypothetical protein
MRDAIVYELVLDPCERVAFLCSWLSPTDRETLCSDTYTPMLIHHFNPGRLPLLYVQVRPADWGSIAQKQTLHNVLWETNVMHSDYTAAHAIPVDTCGQTSLG